MKSPLALGARDGSLLARIRRLADPVGRRQPGGAVVAVFSLFCVGLIAVGVWSVAHADDAVGDTITELTMSTPFRLPDHWIIEDVRFVNDGKGIIAIASQGFTTVRRWDVVDQKLLSEIKLAADKHGRAVQRDTLQLSADGRRVIAATDEYVGIWDAATGDLLKQLSFPIREWEDDCIRCLACSRDLSVIVGGLGTTYNKLTPFHDGHGIVWDGNTGETKATVTHKHGHYFKDIDVSPDGRYFASCTGGGVRIWDTASGKQLRDLSSPR